MQSGSMKFLSLKIQACKKRQLMQKYDSFENEWLVISQGLHFALSIYDTLLFATFFGRFHRFGQHRCLNRL